jgi:hypothetical protein
MIGQKNRSTGWSKKKMEVKTIATKSTQRK